MTQKIPKQLFVVSKPIEDYDWVKVGQDHWTKQNLITSNFGFLHPHDTTKADAKRKETQFSWAYHGTVYQKDEIWYHKSRDYEPGPWPRKEVYYDKPIDLEYAPKIWDNVPLTGFKIIDTVCRYRGNKLFKVLDPRGVEFEVTVASLYTIMMNGEIKNGEIMNACVWKANKNLVIYT